MPSSALVVDSRFKSYLKLVGHLKWEHDMKFQRHQSSLKSTTATIDNECPSTANWQVFLKRREDLNEGLFHCGKPFNFRDQDYKVLNCYEAVAYATGSNQTNRVTLEDQCRAFHWPFKVQVTSRMLNAESQGNDIMLD